jgi:hypothetical protein
MYTDKKEKKIFLIYKEIQMGSVASHRWGRAFFIFYRCKDEGTEGI